MLLRERLFVVALLQKFDQPQKGKQKCFLQTYHVADSDTVPLQTHATDTTTYVRSKSLDSHKSKSTQNEILNPEVKGDMTQLQN